MINDFPKIIFSLLFFFLGSAVGSFLNCLIFRIETNQSFLKGRSFCPHCKHFLSFFDLIPILSFLFLKGKCRYCQRKIPFQYLAIEILTGLLFLLIFWFYFPYFKFSLFNISEFLFTLIISCFLILILVFDLKYFSLPEKIIYPPIFISLFYRVFEIFWQKNYHSFFKILNPFFSAFSISFFFFLIVFLSKEKLMGWGDVFLAFLLGIFLGFPKIIIALFFAFFSGAILGLILISLKLKTLKSEIPFAPFLVSGTFFALFLGEKIINWYLNFILLK